MFCSKCGNKVPDGAKFCSMCGSGIEVGISSGAQATEAPLQSNYSMPSINQPDNNLQYDSYAMTPAKNKSKVKLIVILSISALVTALVVLGWFIFSNDPHESPESVLNAYIDAVNSNDGNDLLELSADYKRSGGDPEMRKNHLEEFKGETDIIDNVRAKIKSVEYEGADRAYVICDVIFTIDGEDEVFKNEKFPCTKIDGEWYWED